MRKGIIFFLVVLVAVFAGMQLYLQIPEVQEKVASYIEEDFREDNIYSDLETLAQRLDEEILNGSDSFTVYLKDMDVNEINQINSSLNGIYGSGETYQQMGTVGDQYKKVRITIQRTINYYVLKAYMDGDAIPDEEKKAQRLYQSVKKVLDSINLSELSDYAKEVAIHDYLVAHCKYSENTDQATDSDIYRAYGALVDGDAVCNGYAEAMQLLLMCAGLNTRFVVGTADGIDHAWNMVELDGNWYHVDTTWDDPLPDQGEDVLHPYFNVTDEIMSANHEWKKEDYPQADHMEYNYYVRNQDYFTDFESYKTKAYQVMISHGNQRYEAVIENYTESEEAMQFIFQGNNRYSSINWQSFGDGNYHVLVLNAQ